MGRCYSYVSNREGSWGLHRQALGVTTPFPGERGRGFRCNRLDATLSRSPLQFYAPAAGTLEVRVAGKQHMAALFADEPLWPLPHRPEQIAQKAIWTTHHLFSHLTPPLVTDSLGLFQAILFARDGHEFQSYKVKPWAATFSCCASGLRRGGSLQASVATSRCHRPASMRAWPWPAVTRSESAGSLDRVRGKCRPIAVEWRTGLLTISLL